MDNDGTSPINPHGFVVENMGTPTKKDTATPIWNSVQQARADLAEGKAVATELTCKNDCLNGETTTGMFGS